MAALAPYIAHGTYTGWGPGLRKQRRIGSLDTLRGIYTSSVSGALKVGVAAPDYPGMLIDDLDEVDDGGGSVEYRVSAVGSLDASRPFKVIGDRKTRSKDAIWDTSQRDLYHDCADIYTGTTSASTDSIDLGSHRFRVGDEVQVLSLGGVCGLAVDTSYFVQSIPTPGRLKLATTAAGLAINLTGNVTILLVLKMFGIGQPHPKHAGMFLASVDTDEDEVLPWAAVRCLYAGVYGAKTYKRTITVNGRVISRDNLRVNFPGGGWSDFRQGTSQQPTLEVSDVQVYASDPNLYQYAPTSDIFNLAGESGRVIPSAILIPNPPAINDIFGLVSGSDVISQWPNRWTFAACELVDSLPGCSVVMIRKVWRYEWVYTL